MTNKSYRCYFTDAGDRIKSYEQIECADDAEAALKVEQLLASSQHMSAELWLGKRLVGKWDNGETLGAVASSSEAKARMSCRPS